MIPLAEGMTRSVVCDKGRLHQPRYDALVICRVRLEWVFSLGARQHRLRVPTRTGRRHRGPKFRSGNRPLLLAPLEFGAVAPEAVQDHGDLARSGDFRLLGAEALHEPRAP